MRTPPSYWNIVSMYLRRKYSFKGSSENRNSIYTVLTLDFD